MAHFTNESWRQCALIGIVALLAACSDKSAAPAAAGNAATQPAATTSQGATTTGASQDATVAELLAGSDSQQPASQQPPAPASSASTPQGSTNPGNAVPAAGTADVEYARVVSVTPVTGPRQVCTNETVTEQRQPDDHHQVAGTVIGAIAGGVIGNQFGGGKGRTLATVGGAVGGGVVGKEVQKNHQSKDTVTRVVKRCHMVDQPAGAAPLYDVVYAYQGENVRVRLDHDPGDRLALPIRGIVNE
ncbi:MAG TPA: glycine zipper 2TM domain-containing protein [Rudaea sp.]|nr:glycine zipper 2TM domain-containing protein [Rudaea sp.]